MMKCAGLRLMDEICKIKTVFANDIALLTLEMAEPRMLQGQKDKRVTLEAMIGSWDYWSVIRICTKILLLHLGVPIGFFSPVSV